jgi:glutamate synthase domain-containing protein 2
MDIVGPEDLKMKIEQLREITDWKIPIIVKYSPGRVKEDVKIAAKAGADIIAIDGMQGGTGASPEIATENAGIPTIAALVQAVEALNEIGMRDEVDIIISGGIRDGADVAKALALGADAVYVCTSVLIAMGCTACAQCHSGRCPVGICTQDPELRKKLDVDEAAERVANYLKVVTEECKMLAQLAGKTDVHNLEKEDLRALSEDVARITGVKMAGSDVELT